jgi:hypothetical protein
VTDCIRAARLSPVRDHAADAAPPVGTALAITAAYKKALEGRPMLRQASVLLGLAVLLSLLFPVKTLLHGSGIDPGGWHLPVVDLAALCAVLAIAPAWFLFRDARLARRIPRWSVWVVLLALCSLLFLLLHVSWSADLLLAWAAGAVADGILPAWVSQHALADALELAARLGVLVALVGVLVHLETEHYENATPEPQPQPRRRRRRAIE